MDPVVVVIVGGVALSTGILVAVLVIVGRREARLIEVAGGRAKWRASDT